MRETEVAEVRAELDDFVARVFVSAPRVDQRAKGCLYLRGLMLDGRRKSMQPMGERLGVDYQQLQQFVSSSPWKVEPVRRQLAKLAVGTIHPEAWVIDGTGFKKDGTLSPCVARQYSGTLGKVGNCQIGVSVHAATDAAMIQARRKKAKITDTVRHRTKWALALEMIDELASWGLRPPVAVADAGYGEITAFRLGLTNRSIPYVLAVKSSTTAHPVDRIPEKIETTGQGHPVFARYRSKPSSLRELARVAGRRQLHQVTWRKGVSSRNGINNHAKSPMATADCN